MTQGLTGLTGIAYGYQRQIDEDAQATPEERLGGPADQRHGQWGEKTDPYPYMSTAGQNGSHGPYGPENQMLGDEQWFWQPAGEESDDITFDRTPVTRAAPFPKGVASGPVPGQSPDDISNQLIQSAALHGVKTGASLKGLYPVKGLGHQNDDWQEIWQVEPGHSDLQPIPRQAMSSGFMWGTTDRTQSMARQNDHGYGSAHMHRRYAAGSIPGNNMWLRPGGRPMVKNMAGPSRPAIGPDSPFHGDDLGASFGIDGAILQNMPSEYAPPAQPNLAPSLTSDAGTDYEISWY